MTIMTNDEEKKYDPLEVKYIHNGIKLLSLLLDSDGGWRNFKFEVVVLAKYNKVGAKNHKRI